MKTLKGFLKSLRVKPVFDGNFSSREDVFNNFAKSEDSDIEFLYADYETPDYEGYATVVFYRKSTKKYYEVYGSHCSCYGLENQWDNEEETVAEELVKRIGALGSRFEEYKK